MKIIFTSLCFLLLPVFAISQMIEIRYEVFSSKSPEPKIGLLVINKSLPSFYSEQTKDTVPKEVVKNKGSSEEIISIVPGSIYKDYQIYPARGDSLINIQKIFGQEKPVRFKEKWEKMQWSLIDETRTISGYPCQRAECDFRGRHFIAWYTQKIPIHLGPWKFSGLPGAILQVYDQREQFSWNAKQISHKPADQKLPANLKDFEKLPSFKAFVERRKQAFVDYVQKRTKLSLIRAYGADAQINMHEPKKKHKKNRNGLERVYPWEKQE